MALLFARDLSRVRGRGGDRASVLLAAARFRHKHRANCLRMSMVLAAVFLAGCSSTGDPGGTPAPDSSRATETTTSRPNATATAVEHARFETVLSLDDDVSLYPAATFFVTLHTSSTSTSLATYASDGVQLGQLADASNVSLDCGLRLVGDEATTALLITGRAEEIPASGLTPPTWNLYLTAWDAVTFTRQWEQPIVTGSPEAVFCDRAALEGASVTSDARWLTYQHWVVDLATGKARDNRDAGELATPLALGNSIMVFQGVCANCLNAMVVLPVTEPSTGETLFEFTGHDLIVALATTPSDYAVTKDGSTLFVALRKNETGLGSLEYALESISLADGTINWAQTGPSYSGPILQKTTLDEAAGVVMMPSLAAAQGTSPAEGQQLLGLSVANGDPLWELPTTTVCSTNGLATSVIANEQLVIVDPRTGEQVAFTADYSICGVPIGDYSYYPEDGVIVRVL